MASQARARLIPFVQATMNSYRAAPVHYLIAEHLEAVERGEVKRLMVFMPPRTGKSELLIRFVAWALGRNPDWSMIYTSYGADLAWEKSHEARNAVASDEFASVFGRQSLAEQRVELSKSSRSVQRWRIQGRRGGLTAQGVGGPLTGKGAHVAIIDDPVKNREEADSFRVREHIWRWYVSTLYTRLEPAGAVILVMTRWHVDDLAGRLLERASSDPLADQWTVLSLPALAEEGEPDPLGRQPGQALNPDRFNEAALASIQTTVGRREWLALYQQRPAPAEGAMFQRAWFNVIGAAPVDPVARVRYWDKAATSGGGDWSVGVLMARTREGRFVVEHVTRGQWSSRQRDMVMRQTAAADAQLPGAAVRTVVEREPGSSGKEAAEAFVRMLAGFPVAVDLPSGSKEVRAQPYAAQAEAGNVDLVAGPWLETYLEELTLFPFGGNDDQVDGSSGSFIWLTTKRGNFFDYLAKEYTQGGADGEAG